MPKNTIGFIERSNVEYAGKSHLQVTFVQGKSRYTPKHYFQFDPRSFISFDMALDDAKKWVKSFGYNPDITRAMSWRNQLFSKGK